MIYSVDTQPTDMLSQSKDLLRVYPLADSFNRSDADTIYHDIQCSVSFGGYE